jgi:hypothetical protein
MINVRNVMTYSKCQGKPFINMFRFFYSTSHSSALNKTKIRLKSVRWTWKHMSLKYLYFHYKIKKRNLLYIFRVHPNWKDISLSNSVKGKTGHPCKSKEIALTTCTRWKDLLTVCYLIFEIYCKIEYSFMHSFVLNVK